MSSNGSEIIIKTILGESIPFNVSNSAKETILDIKRAVSNYFACPYPSLRLIWAGQELDNQRVLNDYGIQKGATIYAVVLSYAISIQIDEDEYMEQSYHVESEQNTLMQLSQDRYYNDNMVINDFKKMIHNDLKDIAECDVFWIQYGLFDDDLHHEEFDGNALVRDQMQKSWSIKTKDGNLYYLQNKRKIHDEWCILLTFGYNREFEMEHKLNVPLAINSIIKKYLNKNDIDFQNH